MLKQTKEARVFRRAQAVRVVDQWALDVRVARPLLSRSFTTVRGVSSPADGYNNLTNINDR